MWLNAFHLILSHKIAWMSRLDGLLQNQHLPPMRILLLTVEYEEPWHFIASERSVIQKPVSGANRTNKHPAGLLFTDISSVFYVLRASVPRMASTSAKSSSDPSFINDFEEDKPVDSLQIRCLHSTTLIRVPSDTDHVHISMLHLHLLQSTQLVHSSDNIANKDVLDEVTRNFHELAVLTRCRWKLNANPILPFHLAALEVIGSALSRSDIVTD
jgi:mediator of RNA polymerase II transcription subunit 13, fungi type